ncbi:helicase [Burkholderia sp. 22PA0099]|uniref:helicase n=1 Tax=Burkholderia sp. 22PA0099 TaxID=3237372 RepID=UPI0039C1BF27
MSWFIYEVPEYHEDGARIEPFTDLRNRVLKVSGQGMADELESVRENAAATANTPEHPLRNADNPHVFPIPYADSMILVGFIFETKRDGQQLVVSPVDMPWLDDADTDA